MGANAYRLTCSRPPDDRAALPPAPRSAHTGPKDANKSTQGDSHLMRRAMIFALLAAVLAAGNCLAQAKKASKDSKPAARLEFVQEPAPVPSRFPVPSEVARKRPNAWAGSFVPRSATLCSTRWLAGPPAKRSFRPTAKSSSPSRGTSTRLRFSRLQRDFLSHRDI